MLAGFLDREMTTREIDRLLEKGKEWMVGANIPHLIAPAVITREVARRGETLVEERLPRVACLARFDSGELPGSDNSCSSLVVAWFQGSFGLPAEDVLEEIGRIDWESEAQGWDW